MPWIQNVSMERIRLGHHIPTNAKTILIQLVDPEDDFPTPFHTFSTIHQFKFKDSDEGDAEAPESRITDGQASALVEILKDALENNRDVVVHCAAGVCRSGAVHEVGVIMGFSDTETHRIPNLLVKNKMLRVLGLTYD